MFFYEPKNTDPEKIITCFVVCKATDGKICAPCAEEKKNHVRSCVNEAVFEARCTVPPSVAERRKWVPYFLIRLSVIV